MWLLVALVVGCAVSSCTIAKISGRGAVPMYLNAPQSKVESVSHLEQSKMLNFDYTGAIDASEVLGEALAKAGGDALINVVMTLKVTPANFFINLVTLGIANSRTFVVSGDVVKTSVSLLDKPGVELLGNAATVRGLAPYLSELSADRPLAVVKTDGGFAVASYPPGLFETAAP
jgi:hypothetical protein